MSASGRGTLDLWARAGANRGRCGQGKDPAARRSKHQQIGAPENGECRAGARRSRDSGVTLDERMNAATALEVLDGLQSIACPFWLEGGWGVDALVGEQARPHRDVDVDFDATREAEVLELPEQPGVLHRHRLDANPA
jgi:hypothetical protein